MSQVGLLNAKAAFGGALLVTGCCIGAGMIGLPVVSALAGFMPSTVAMFLCYVFTTLTGLLLLEATLWFDTKVNLPSIVESTLGKVGKAITLALFLFLFYCLFVAYLDGGGLLFADMLASLLHHPVSRQVGVLACVSFVSAVTYVGTKLVDGLNRALLFGLIVSYLVMVFIGFPNVQNASLAYSNWDAAMATVPILLICFGYQNIVPSLTYYLEKNVKALRIAIIVGNLIPFFIYVLWNYVILGMLPVAHAVSAGEVDMVTQLLHGAMPNAPVVFFIKAFSLFAILTSFLPNAISFVDFLKDGFKKTFHREQKNELVVYGLIFIPPSICTLLYPHLFLEALNFAGGFIDVLLYGVLPALVILVGRNIKKMTGPYRVIGGNVTPMIILILSAFVLIFKVS